MNAKTMRKASAAFAIAITISSTATAQNEGRSVRLGLSIAPNMGWIKPTGKLVKSDGSRLGFRFGLMTDFLLGKNANYAFATGIYLNHVGLKYARDYGYTTTSVQVNGSPMARASTAPKNGATEKKALARAEPWAPKAVMNSSRLTP